MRTAWHDIWGCARGPVARLLPHARILAGTGVFAGCMAAPTLDPAGAGLAAGAAVLWMGACAPPFRAVRVMVVFGLVALLPYFALVALLGSEAPGTRSTLAIAWDLFLRAMCGLVVSVATLTTLRASDLREGLVRLPVPEAVSAILLQIVHQTALLAYETSRVASAISVRGASAGHRTAWRLLASLPRVWLPRIVERADRVADAMELRGYCESNLGFSGRVRIRLADGVALLLTWSVFAAALAIRYRSGR